MDRKHGRLVAVAETAIAAAALMLAGNAVAGDDSLPGKPAEQMKLWKEIDLGPCQGSFPCLGDLDGDGKVDFLLYRQGPQTTPGYMAALSHEGKKLWEMGDPAIQTHMPDGLWNEPALRGVALIYDIDQDGKSEVVSEFWIDGKPMLYVLDGATGTIRQSRQSPLDLEVRGGKRSRCHPVGRIAFLQGPDQPPSLVMIYGASGRVPSHVVALDARLQTIWHVTADPKAAAHVPAVGDVDGDGREETVCGALLVDPNGKSVWEREYLNHADCVAILPTGKPERTILLAICNTGPAACLSARGETVWETTRAEVSHGQGAWAGNFIESQPGQEVIICRSGHHGDFLTVRANDGAQLGAFQHRREFEGYPDFPCVANWKSKQVQSLWIPIDRSLVDGTGGVVAELGGHEERVRDRLRWGTTKSQVATQAFALDLCGDQRDELVLYQPYNGQSIFIFTQADSDGRAKPYMHQPSVYNIQSYF